MFVFAVLGSLALSACSKKEVATQVAARVGTDEISVHEINAVLGKFPSDSQMDAAQLRRDVLEKLIDQRLAADQATNNKLDRTPEVVLAIEQAKHEILAQAYMRQVVGRLSKPSVVDANRYYDSHPALFSERRIYNLHELDVEEVGTMEPKLSELVAQGKTLDEISAWLQLNKIVFKSNTATRAADELPLNIIDKLHATRDGGIIAIETPGDDFHIMQIVSSQVAPIDRTTAQPKIEQFLINEQMQEAADGELKRLRTVTKIEYMGDFAKASPAAESTQSSPLNAATATAAAPIVPAAVTNSQ